MQATLRQMETPSNPFLDLIKNLNEEEERLRIALEMVQKGKETMLEIYNRYPHNEHSDPLPEFNEQKVSFLPTGTATRVRKSNIPTEYKKTDTYGKKILFILNKLGEATTPELTEYILEQEPDLKPSLVSLNVGKNATRLLEDDKVAVEKVGNTNRYMLK